MFKSPQARLRRGRETLHNTLQRRSITKPVLVDATFSTTPTTSICGQKKIDMTDLALQPRHTTTCSAPLSVVVGVVAAAQKPAAEVT